MIASKEILRGIAEGFLEIRSGGPDMGVIGPIGREFLAAEPVAAEPVAPEPVPLLYNRRS